MTFVIRSLTILAASAAIIGCAATIAPQAVAQTQTPPAPKPAAPAAPGLPAPAPVAAPAAAAVPAAGAATTVTVGADGFPVGPGHDILMNACSACHAPDMVLSKRQDHAAWDSLVQDMIGKGAALSPEEAKTVTDYLAANLGVGMPPLPAPGAN
jgi:hypothetical protein